MRDKGSGRRIGTIVALGIVIALGTMGTSGCGDDSDESPAPFEEDDFPVGDPATGVPSGEMRTIEITDEMVASGRTIYADNCVPCHGEEGVGTLGVGPALNSETFLAAASDNYLMRTIWRGRTGTTMPAWGPAFGHSGVTELVSYMRSWNDVEPAELNDAPAEGDADAGEEVFRSICAACHGNSGAGYQEIANGTGIGRAAFLADASNGYLRHLVEHGKSNTPMRPFQEGAPTAVANLTPEQIEDVITYLRANAW